MVDTIEIDLLEVLIALESGFQPSHSGVCRCVPEVTTSPGVLSAFCAKYLSRINDIFGPNDLDAVDHAR